MKVKSQEFSELDIGGHETCISFLLFILIIFFIIYLIDHSVAQLFSCKDPVCSETKLVNLLAQLSDQREIGPCIPLKVT